MTSELTVHEAATLISDEKPNALPIITSTLSSFGIPNGDGSGRGGVLMPKTKDRFRVVLTNDTSDSSKNDFTQQVVSVSMKQNLSTGLAAFGLSLTEEGDLNLAFRDDICNGAIDHLLAFKKGNPGTLTIDVLTGGDDGALCSYVYDGVKITKHNFSFDYSSADPVFHKLKLSFTGWSVVKPQKL